MEAQGIRDRPGSHPLILASPRWFPRGSLVGNTDKVSVSKIPSFRAGFIHGATFRHLGCSGEFACESHFIRTYMHHFEVDTPPNQMIGKVHAYPRQLNQLFADHGCLHSQRLDLLMLTNLELSTADCVDTLLNVSAICPIVSTYRRQI